MAFPTSINNQITDSVSQTSVSVFGTGGAVAVGSLQQGTAQAMNLAASGLVMAADNLNTLRQASTNAAIAQLLNDDEVAL